MSTSKRLAGRLALITGASRGIGRAIALRYAQEGAQIIAVARTQGALEELDDEVRKISGQPAVLIAESITDVAKINQVGAALHERFGKLDILVGSAGDLGQLSPMGHYKPKMWHDIFDINLHANWYLLAALDPLLRQSDAGRAIFVSSIVATEVRMYWGPYAVSKAALEHMVKIYALEMAHTNVRANIVNPGGVRTKMRAAAFPGEDPATLPAPEDIVDIFVDLAEASCDANGETFHAQKPTPVRRRAS
jgi:NAD(P)-dependent dehydrogenase (short-subunit alcohol dehydrogenase family)